MSSISEIKSFEVTGTPLLLFQCTLPNGHVERWSTHEVSFADESYAARVVRHNVFDIRGTAEDGIDALSRISLSLANADGHFSQLTRNPGWKGAKLTAQFAFFDPIARVAASDAAVLFQGTCNPPDEVTETIIRLTFTSRLNLQRTFLPDVRIQRRCPWMFPTTPEQRQVAVAGSDRGKFSPFYRCGYSPDQEGGAGSLNGLEVFTACDYTRANCEQRGMFSSDASGRPTRRFGGVEFVPSNILVKSYGDKAFHLSSTTDNEAKFNDFVPVLYGRAWYRPPVVFARNDGNLTRMEVLLGMGEMTDVLKVVVNGIEVPIGRSGSNMTGTGWYNVVSLGNRTGSFNLDFRKPDGTPAGDPYGGMATLSVVVPNRISDGKSIPRIEILADGMKLTTYDASGAFIADVYTNNPAWVLLDILRRCGWSENEVDLESFAATAAYCMEPVVVSDLNGSPHSSPRFQCNLVLRRRRSAADVIRGVRNNSALFLTYGLDGRLRLGFESSLANQHTAKPDGSNSTATLNGGWPAYEFGDGSSPFSDILRTDSGEPAIRLFSRPTADAPNRYSVEFQDEFNEYQQDSLSLVDIADATLANQEISASLTALGLPNFNQAARILRLQLDRSLRGNLYVELETGLRSVMLRPGDLITLSYLREGFDRQPFRVSRIAPGLNYRSSVITAQIHQDSWYTGSGEGELGVIGGGRQPGFEIGIPRPISGDVFDEDLVTRFSIAAEQGSDSQLTLRVGYIQPSAADPSGPLIPTLSLTPQVETSGGTLRGTDNYYYAISAVDENGRESPLSFSVRATTGEGSDTYSVTLRDLSFAPGVTRFNVYRGGTPSELVRIAADEPVQSSFTDQGRIAVLALPPDRNYHHSNFYWRWESMPATKATHFSASTIGAEALGMIPDEHRGKMVVIVQGRGTGQEHVAIGNTSTTLTIVGKWAVEPDGTSFFAICDAGWQFGSVSQSSPATVTVPNRSGASIQISGRSANAFDQECPYELCPLTRYQIGQGSGSIDTSEPPLALFSASTSGQGGLEISAISFSTLENTRTISAGTLTLHYTDEVSGDPAVPLIENLTPEMTEIALAQSIGAEPGDLVQVEAEIMQVDEVLAVDGRYRVTRASHDTGAGEFPANTDVRRLLRKVFVMPFAHGFFGSPASGSFSFPVSLPDSRVSAADLMMTNARGNGPVAQLAFTGTTDAGLRTLSGGQVAMQVEGYLAVESNAVPPVVVDTTHSIRDVFALIGEAPYGSDLTLRVTVDGATYADLTVAAGELVSNSVGGFGWRLPAGARIGLDVLSVGSTLPGRDLSVTIRM